MKNVDVPLDAWPLRYQLLWAIIIGLKKQLQYLHM